MQLKMQLERTEAILEDEQTQRQKLTAEFEEVRLPRAVGASLGQGGGSRELSRVPPQGVSLRHRHPPPVHMGPDPLPRSVQAQLVSSRLQGELEKLRCSSALGSSEAEEATRLKVQGSPLSPPEAPRAASSLIWRLARSGGIPKCPVSQLDVTSVTIYKSSRTEAELLRHPGHRAGAQQPVPDPEAQPCDPQAASSHPRPHVRSQVAFLLCVT